MSDLGRTFFALQSLTGRKWQRTVVDCFDAGIRIAMERKEFEVAAALRDLREQLVDRKSETIKGIVMFETEKIIDHCRDQDGWRMKAVREAAERIDDACFGKRDTESNGADAPPTRPTCG
jgi:hypothetical protein